LPLTRVVIELGGSVILPAVTVPRSTAFSLAEVRIASYDDGKLLPARVSGVAAVPVLIATMVKAPICVLSKATARTLASLLLASTICAPGRM